MDDSEKESKLKELAAQLRKPHNENGIRVGEMMHETNFGMTKSAIHALSLQPTDSVLELGHGNGSHLGFLLSQTKALQYTGLDISSLMKEEALRLNMDLLSTHAISFHLYDGIHIPFSDSSFNKGMTVNTIYFWDRPHDLINELYRILKVGGLFSIVFAQKEFMEQLPFTVHGFQLYDTPKMEALIKESPFKIVDVRHTTERVKGNLSEEVERLYTTITLQK